MANMISSFLHPEDAYKNAEKEANQGYGQFQNYLNPYNQQGQAQYGRLNQATGALLDPAALESQWAQGYETSPYAKQMLESNRSQGLDAASSMGLSGSSASLGNIQQGAGEIVQKYRQQYLNDLMNKYMTGIGLGKDLYGQGAQAANTLGQGALQHGNDVAGLAYGRTQEPGQLFGQLAGAGISAATGGLSNLAGHGAMSPFMNNLFNSSNQFNSPGNGGH